jgi:hypothetical protein
MTCLYWSTARYTWRQMPPTLTLYLPKISSGLVKQRVRTRAIILPETIPSTDVEAGKSVRIGDRFGQRLEWSGASAMP